jgi:hypothetical protein
MNAVIPFQPRWPQIPWWDVQHLRESLTLTSSDGHYRFVRRAIHRGALLMPCPYCLAAIGERCESVSGRSRDPHWPRERAWCDLSATDRARLATSESDT